MWKNNDEKSEVAKCNIMDLRLIVGMCVKVVLSPHKASILFFVIYEQKVVCSCCFMGNGCWWIIFRPGRV